MKSVYSAVRTDSLYKADYVSSLEGLFNLNFNTKFIRAHKGKQWIKTGRAAAAGRTVQRRNKIYFTSTESNNDSSVVHPVA